MPTIIIYTARALPEDYQSIHLLPTSLFNLQFLSLQFQFAVALNSNSCIFSVT